MGERPGAEGRLRRVKTSIDYETAKKRALDILDKDTPTVASVVGCVLWPDVTMTSQGLGGAASRILKRMERDGLVRWTSNEFNWGWVKNG